MRAAHGYQLLGELKEKQYIEQKRKVTDRKAEQ